MAVSGIWGAVRGLVSRGIWAAVGAFTEKQAARVAGAAAATAGKTLIPEGEALLVAVKDGKIIRQTADVMMSHARLAERTFGSSTLPKGAWVGTVGKAGGEISTLNSKTMMGNQGAAPAAVQELMKSLFY
jgi:hypothetical protein